jgi:hypothetical protein
MKSLPFIVMKKPEMMQTMGRRGLGCPILMLRISLFLRLLTTPHARVLNATL